MHTVRAVRAVRSRWARAGLAAALLVAAVLLSYFPVLSAPLASDDWTLVLAARDAPFSWGWCGFLRPLIMLSLAGDWWLHGTWWPGYHVTNLLWHTVASLGAAWVAVEAAKCSGLGARAFRCGLLGGLAFAVLAPHSEAVAWVAGRTDVIAGAFSFAGFALSLRIVRRPDASVWLSPLAVFLFAAALLAKESALPSVLLWSGAVLLTWPQARRHRRAVLGHFLLCCALLVGYFLLRNHVLGTFVGGYGGAVHLNLNIRHLARGLAQCGVRLILPPSPLLTGRYSHAGTLGWPWFATFGVALAAAVSLAARDWRRSMDAPRRRGALRGSVLAVFWTLGALTLVVGMGVSTVSTQGERFLYAPSMFVAVFAGILLMPLLDHSAGQLAVLALLCLQGIACAASSSNWAHAGRLCVGIVEQLARLPKQPQPILVNMLDNYRGAFVFRNGLSSALVLAGQAANAGPFAEPLFLNSVWSAGDDPIVDVVGNRISVRFEAPAVLYATGTNSLQALPHGASLIVEPRRNRAILSGILPQLPLAVVQADGTVRLLDGSTNRWGKGPLITDH